MIYYRLYGFGPDNHIHDVVEISCSDDSEAMNRAITLASRFSSVEIWECARIVGKFTQGEWKLTERVRNQPMKKPSR
jgi:hypothetical protein